MQFLPLLGQDDAQLVKTFDEAGCQTSPPASGISGPQPSTLLDFMSSFEDLDEIISGLDTPAVSACHDAAPPTYSHAITQSDPFSTLGLDLDRSTLVSGPSLQPHTTPVYVGAPMSRLPDDTLARSRKIGPLLNPVPPGIYMRARPMIWDSTSSAATATAHEAHRFGNDAHHLPTSAHPDLKCSGLPPWRRPSVAQVAFQKAPTYHGHVFRPYTHTPASQFDAVPRHHVPQSLAYPPPPHRHPNPYLASNARIDPSSEHLSSMETPLSAYSMPGTYPPSPPSTSISPSYDFPESCRSTPRRHTGQRQGSLTRRTRIHHGCESCYPSPPASPSSSIRTDSTCSSPNFSPGLDLHLFLHTPSHSSSALPHESIGVPAHTMRLSIPPPSPMQPSVVNISIALPSPCSSHRHDRFYHRASSLCTILIPLACLMSLMVYAFGAVFPPTRPSSSSSLLHAPLVWRALSGLLSYVFRMMKDADVKI
ncbi:hypothetical protein LXA43DRAFT_362063 [Ganoderma leucocontextum]|nr:hypothetical protein LXA43DRAFT_362063 [Ganoderma leucocontextum]